MILEFLTMEGRRVLFSFKTGSVSVSLNKVEVYSFDLEGRPLTFWIQDQTFVRTLDNRIIKKWRDLDESPSWKRISELGNEEKQPSQPILEPNA